MPQQQPFPVRFSVDYPDRVLDRVTTAFRIFVAIPILIVLSAVSGAGGVGGLLFFGPLLMILFRQKYPRWWFDWNLELQRFSNRVGAYFALMNDRYPSTTEHQSVHLEYDYPNAESDLNRWLPLVKWFLAIPPLPRAGHSLRRRRGRCDRRVVRHPVHWPIPEGHLRLRGGSDPVAQPSSCLRLYLDHRPVPAL
jgi:hypothetical protein